MKQCPDCVEKRKTVEDYWTPGRIKNAEDYGIDWEWQKAWEQYCHTCGGTGLVPDDYMQTPCSASA